jgi:hypothetical protein
MLLMIGIMIASFAYVSGQEAELRTGRMESRHIRVARQALMEADVAVLNAMVDGAAGHAGRYRTATSASIRRPSGSNDAKPAPSPSSPACGAAGRRSWSASKPAILPVRVHCTTRSASSRGPLRWSMR